MAPAPTRYWISLPVVVISDITTSDADIIKDESTCIKDVSFSFLMTKRTGKKYVAKNKA